MPCKFNFLILFLLLHVINFAQSKQALISGGMLYNKLSDSPITVNPSTIIFYRHLNISHIAKGVSLGGRYLMQYQELCSKLQRRIYTDNRKTAEKEFTSLSG